MINKKALKEKHKDSWIRNKDSVTPLYLIFPLSHNEVEYSNILSISLFKKGSPPIIAMQ